MYIVQNKTLLDKNGNVIKTINEEVFLTADIDLNVFEYGKYVDAVKSNMSLHVIKLYILNDDETPMKDVSTYVLSGSLNYNYQQGQTHSLTLELSNSDGYWVAAPINGTIWRGTKFRLDIGLYYEGTVFWRRCGIFVLKSSNFSGGTSQKVSLQLHDKFALYDGTIGRRIDSDFAIEAGQPLKKSIGACIVGDDKNKPIDSKTIYFESDLSEITTPYKITKTPNTNLGDIIIELADMVSHDVFYNETGNLVLRPGTESTIISGKIIASVPYESRPVQWHYTDYKHLSYKDPSYSIDYGAITNKVVVKGAISGGTQCKGVAENNNPYSKSNIDLCGVNSELIEDKNITLLAYATERAEYELNKRLINYTKNSFQSIFIPHLRPKDIVMWTCPEFNIYNEKFIIQSLSFNFGSGFLMNIEMSNIRELM